MSVFDLFIYIEDMFGAFFITPFLYFYVDLELSEDFLIVNSMFRFLLMIFALFFVVSVPCIIRYVFRKEKKK